MEVRLRLGEGLTLSHAGYVAVEPDGLIVIADVVDENRYFTTVLRMSAFESIRMSESESAIVFERPNDSSSAINEVIVACRSA